MIYQRILIYLQLRNFGEEFLLTRKRLSMKQFTFAETKQMRAVGLLRSRIQKWLFEKRLVKLCVKTHVWKSSREATGWLWWNNYVKTSPTEIMYEIWTGLCQLKFCDLRTFLKVQLRRYSDQTFGCMMRESCLILGCREKSFPQLQIVYTVCGAYPALSRR